MQLADENEIALWQRARNIIDLGILTNQWLEGRISFHPCYGSIPDIETQSILSSLIRCNNKGFLTINSQPGRKVNRQGYRQRAFVDGLANEQLAKDIAKLGLSSDLLVFVFPPNREVGVNVPVTVDDFHPFTWAGVWSVYEQLDCFMEICSPEAIKSLQSAWYVCIIDLNWGRRRYLWKRLDGILDDSDLQSAMFRVNPSPSLDLDTDFVF